MQIKAKYKGKIFSNGKVAKVIVDEIKQEDFKYLSMNGFDFLFEHVKKKKIEIEFDVKVSKRGKPAKKIGKRKIEIEVIEEDENDISQ